MGEFEREKKEMERKIKELEQRKLDMENEHKTAQVRHDVNVTVTSCNLLCRRMRGSGWSRGEQRWIVNRKLPRSLIIGVNIITFDVALSVELSVSLSVLLFVTLSVMLFI